MEQAINKQAILDTYNVDIDNLIVFSSQGDECGFRPTWSYLHGELEQKLNYDIFDIRLKNESDEQTSWINYKTSKGNTDADNWPDGIYDCKTEDGLECKWFLWSVCLNENSMVSSAWRRKGLVVLVTDTKSMKYAQECYDNKVMTI